MGGMSLSEVSVESLSQRGLRNESGHIFRLVGEGRDQARVSAILGGVSLAALGRAVYRSAGFLPMPYLRTLDAPHVEAAIRLGVDRVLTYDHRLAEASTAVGFDVIAPGGEQTV